MGSRLRHHHVQTASAALCSRTHPCAENRDQWGKAGVLHGLSH